MVGFGWQLSSWLAHGSLLAVTLLGRALRTSSNLNYFPKVASLPTITLQVRAPPHEFWEDANIRSITGSVNATEGKDRRESFPRRKFSLTFPETFTSPTQTPKLQHTKMLASLTVTLHCGWFLLLFFPVHLPPSPPSDKGTQDLWTCQEYAWVEWQLSTRSPQFHMFVARYFFPIFISMVSNEART